MTTDSRTKSIDMLHGSLTGRLILFALPIAFSSMLQQLFNAADTAVVGANVLIARLIGDGSGRRRLLSPDLFCRLSFFNAV